MNIKKKMKQMQYEYKRKKIAKQMTRNLGKVVIKSNTLFCYVDKDCVDKKRRINFSLPECFRDNELIEKYDLKKKICFVVEHANFQKGLQFSVDKNIQVIFRNCSFHKHVEITNAIGEVAFENNMYFQNPENSAIPFFNADANNLIFLNEYLINSGNKSVEESNFSLRIKANQIRMVNSLLYVGADDAGIDIKAQTLTLCNTTINCSKISIDADKIDVTASTIYANDFAIIENKGIDKISIIETPEIVYNGQEFKAKDEKNIVIRNNISDLIRRRLQLLESLKYILNTSKQMGYTGEKISDTETLEKIYNLKQKNT